jgi:hypothetical protein
METERRDQSRLDGVEIQKLRAEIARLRALKTPLVLTDPDPIASNAGIMREQEAEIIRLRAVITEAEQLKNQHAQNALCLQEKLVEAMRYESTPMRINELLAEIETANATIRVLTTRIGQLEKSNPTPGFYWVRDAMTMGSPHYRVAELRQSEPYWLLSGRDGEYSFVSFVPVSPRLIDPVDALPEASPDAEV